MFSFFKSKKKKDEIPLTDEQINWNKVWSLFDSGELKDINSDIYYLAEYEAGVSGEGHSGFLCNDEEIIPEITSALKNTLPEDLFDNYIKALKSYDTEDEDEICGLCDEYFFENENIIIDILQEFGNKINNQNMR